MALISTICPECHESVKVDDSKPFGFCFSCGAKIALAVTVTEKQSGPSMSDTINNYIQLATSAKSAGNNAQCEMYCNKIIELDAKNAAAWALKASASGWQSSLANIRVNEMIQYYSQAVSYAENAEQKEKIQKLATSDYGQVMKGIVDLQCNRFRKWPDADEASAFQSLYKLFLQGCLNLISGILYTYDFDADLFEIGVKINDAVVDAEQMLINNHCSSNQGHPTDYDFRRFIERMGFAYYAYEVATQCCKDDYKNFPVILDNMIMNHIDCMRANSYHQVYVDYVGFVWEKNLSLTNSARSIRSGQIDELKARKRDAEVREMEKKKIIREECKKMYWDLHEDEKKRLEDEKATKQNEIKILQERLEQIENDQAIIDQKWTIKRMEEDKEKLGRLKFKEKKELDLKIIQKKNELDNILKEKREPLEAKISEKENEIKRVDRELTKDHPEYEGKTKTKPYNGTKTARENTVYIKG